MCNFSLPSIVNVDKAIHLYFHLDKFLGKMQRCMKQIVGNKNNLFSHSAASSVWRHQIIHNRNDKCNICDLSKLWDFILRFCDLLPLGKLRGQTAFQWEKMSHTERYQSMPDKNQSKHCPILFIITFKLFIYSYHFEIVQNRKLFSWHEKKVFEPFEPNFFCPSPSRMQHNW